MGCQEDVEVCSVIREGGALEEPPQQGDAPEAGRLSGSLCLRLIDEPAYDQRMGIFDRDSGRGGPF